MHPCQIGSSFAYFFPRGRRQLEVSLTQLPTLSVYVGKQPFFAFFLLFSAHIFARMHAAKSLFGAAQDFEGMRMSYYVFSCLKGRKKGGGTRSEFIFPS